MDQTGLRCRWADGLGWALLYGALWALFTGGSGWLLGVPSILSAVGLSLWLGIRPWRLSLTALPGFLRFFLCRMVMGGWDVAWRALHPRCPLQPAWHQYSLASQSPRMRLLLSAMVGLLPGTLVSRIDGEQMQVHVLDERLPWRATIAELEQRLERLLGASGKR
ncbi:Na+/H+ antiporter subunit E [Stutzerimonas stutzeri]|uniref:Na+/H+ antiporter subunit E n=1 Tax=Stutzerimonas stutzeri TaxID=316 RepID=UPI0015E47334|nr:Na+/H+ antiporter subunit E [Stutzerimonas stutzeri]MBA1264096.1 Na+/H+ antiporter subunit E [Stutzerimonas stutzeri]